MTVISGNWFADKTMIRHPSFLTKRSHIMFNKLSERQAACKASTFSGLQSYTLCLNLYSSYGGGLYAADRPVYLSIHLCTNVYPEAAVFIKWAFPTFSLEVFISSLSQISMKFLSGSANSTQPSQCAWMCKPAGLYIARRPFKGHYSTKVSRVNIALNFIQSTVAINFRHIPNTPHF